MARSATLFERLLFRAKLADHAFLVAIATVIGCLGGLGAVGFRKLISLVQRWTWGDWNPSLELIRSHPGWWIVLAPAVGGLVVGPMVYFLAREAKGHGVPEVMEAVALRAGAIRPRLVVIKTLASAVCIGSGGSVGREGPIVQIGSALGSAIGQVLRVSGRRLRTLVGCGAAAGIAATFNAPIAGALFAVEVILADFAVARFSPIVISSVIATVVSRHFLGNHPAFDVPAYRLVSAWELPIYLVVGLLAAAVSLAFIWGLYKLEDVFDASPVPPWLAAATGGLMVGGLGLAHPEILGVGYEAITDMLQGRLAVELLLALMVLKLLATCLTIGSGGSGGILAPSLFLGATLGGVVGLGAHELLPAVTASPGAYALVGMGAVVAGTTHAPLTAILIIFELTSDYSLIVPLMMSCIIATLVTTRLKRESIYTMKLVRRGLDLSHGQDVNVLKALQVADVMEEPPVVVPAGAPLGELVGELASSPRPVVYVVGRDRRLKGFIAAEDVRAALEHVDGAPFLLAADLAREDLRTLTPETGLDTVMRIFAGKNREELPVVAGDGSGRLVGVVGRRHLLDAYQTELMKRDVVAELGGSLDETAHEEIHLGKDFRMTEIDAPGAFTGRTIRDLDVRARWGAEVLLIRRPNPSAGDEVEIVPEPDTTVHRGDRLVVLARKRDLARLRAL
jgi:CIC family chloride channel protein